MKLNNFATIEGIDGSGKSSQVKLLKQRLSCLGINVVTTREPGGTPLAELLRTMLVERSGCSMTPSQEALLFAAARADHMSRVILPGLASGAFVICDRFSDSTRVYQGSRGVSEAELDALDSYAIGDDGPSTTFIIDIPVELSLARAAARRSAVAADFFEAQAPLFATFRAKFLSIAKANPQRCIIVDGTKPIEEISDEIFHIVLDRFGLSLNLAVGNRSAGI